MKKYSYYANQISVLIAFVFITSCCFNQVCAQSANNTNNRPAITVDLSKSIGPMYPAWAWFGYDEPNYTYMKDGKKLLTEISH